MKLYMLPMIACVIFLNIDFLHASMPGTLGAPKNMADMSNMSEEELMQFQKEVNTQIEEFVRTLPEEEQKQFYKDVEELSQIMSTMSEEELMQFMDQVLTEEQPQQLEGKPSSTKPATEVMPTIASEEKQKSVEVKQPAVTTQPFIASIDMVLDALERFLLKAQIIPELSGNISNWIEQGKIKQWQSLTTWNQLQEQINTLVYMLKKTKERDPQKTHLYRYLGYVDESLQKIIQDLSVTLSTYEPKVEAPAFGLGKVSKNSRSAIQAIVNAVGDALHTHHILDRLDKVFKGYEPREQELTKMEEEQRKKTLESSKTKTQAIPVQQVGTGTGSGFVAIPTSQNLPEASHARYTEPFSYAYEQPAEERAHRKTETLPEKRAGSGIKKETKESGKEKAIEKEKDKESDSAKKKTVKLEDKKADLYLKTIDRQLDKILDLYTTVPTLRTLQEYVRGKKPIDTSLVEAVRTITAAATRAVDQAKALSLHSKNLSKESSEYYIDELKHKGTWYKEQFEPLLKDAQILLEDTSKFTADRRYAYFSEIDQQEAASKIVKDLGILVSQPASLQEMVDALQEFYKIAAPKPKRTLENPYGIEQSKKEDKK